MPVSKNDKLWARKIIIDKILIIRKIAYLHDVLMDALYEFNNVFAVEVIEFALIMKDIKYDFPDDSCFPPNTNH